VKLTDLHPEWRHWHHDAVRDGAIVTPATSREKAIGLAFDCPIHGAAHRVYVDFANPFDGADPVKRNNLWQRTGDSFETLTTNPSVDYTKYDNGMVRDASCWHGFITNGEVS
jgi:hypothetical protein